MLKHPWVTGHSLRILGSWVGVACTACSTGLYSSCTSTGALATFKRVYVRSSTLLLREKGGGMRANEVNTLLQTRELAIKKELQTARSVKKKSWFLKVDHLIGHGVRRMRT